MIKSSIKTLAIISFLSLSSCAVIHFENGDVVPDPGKFSLSFGLFEDDEPSKYDTSLSERHRRWYHHSIYQVAELSNPLETSQVCVGLDWNQVTTEVTPFDVVMGLLDNAILFNAGAVGLDLWSPWSVEYSCRAQR